MAGAQFPLTLSDLFLLAPYRGQEEEARWSAAVKAANALQTRTCEALAHKIARLDLAEAGEVDEQALDDEAEREAARLAMGVLRKSEEPSVTLPDDLEFQVGPPSVYAPRCQTTPLTDSLFSDRPPPSNNHHSCTVLARVDSHP